MAKHDTPPAPGSIHVDAPPDSPSPTTAMLKADIDSGRTGDKVEHYDVGLSPLGTDDEAAGLPPSPERVALARAQEAASPRVRARADVHGSNRWVMPAFLGFVIVVAAVVGVALWLS